MIFDNGEPILNEFEDAAFDAVYDCLLEIVNAYEDTCDDSGEHIEPPVGKTPYAAAANLLGLFSSFQLGLTRLPEVNTESRAQRMRFLRYAAGELIPLPKGHDPNIPF